MNLKHKTPTTSLLKNLQPLQIVRGAMGNPNRIEGYGAVFFDSSNPGGTSFDLRRSAGFIERFAPGAFDESLAGSESIVSYYNHNAERMLGQTDGGTLSLAKDDKGIRYSIPFQAGDPDHEYVAGKIQNQIVRGSSIHALVTDFSTSKEQGQKVVTITRAVLFEIGPVASPAYRSTTAKLRSEFHAHVMALPDGDDFADRDFVFREKVFERVN